MDFITDTLMIFVRSFQETRTFAELGFWLFQVIGCLAFVFLILLKVGFFDICFKRFAIAACVFSCGGLIFGLIKGGEGSFIVGQAIAVSILFIGVPFRLYPKTTD
ncbi:hypothetical protein OTK49_03085 [Vibrio coralliirubri]|uniref:hypothetical protein n=1 Tax=Vibrio coralliirubri TaxID=1516159 RepID=UPI00228517BA|nr:hypothetical protein [Vibrio coralliirubri]MCY9861500.1 hypothetical protein [Vibrio coralliirubri]